MRLPWSKTTPAEYEILAQACEIAIAELAGNPGAGPNVKAKGLFPKLRTAAAELRGRAGAKEAAITNLYLGPEDILVLTTDQRLSRDTLDHMQKNVDGALGVSGRRVALVLPEGLHVQVVHKMSWSDREKVAYEGGRAQGGLDFLAAHSARKEN